MAGRVKHMERSHRSYRQNTYGGVFNQFHANAYRVSTLKEQRLTLGQRMSRILKPLKETMRHAVSN